MATSELRQGCIGACDFRRDGPKPRRNPSIRSGVGGIIGAVSGFSSVSCLETWRIPVPRIRDRLHRIEPRSPNSRPGVRPEGLSLALPTVRPGGHIRSGWSGSVASAPRTPWSECALCPGRFLTSAAWFLWNWPQLHHAPVCDEVFVDWPLPRRGFPGRCTTDHLGRAASSSSPRSSSSPESSP